MVLWATLNCVLSLSKDSFVRASLSLDSLRAAVSDAVAAAAVVVDVGGDDGVDVGGDVGDDGIVSGGIGGKRGVVSVCECVCLYPHPHPTPPPPTLDNKHLHIKSLHNNKISSLDKAIIA